MSRRPTPETDAEAEKLDFKVDLNFARKLERERDEAREVLREIAEANNFDNIGNWARNKARKALENTK